MLLIRSTYHGNNFHEVKLQDHYSPAVGGVYLIPYNQDHGPRAGNKFHIIGNTRRVNAGNRNKI